ncbi:MAG: hypothetical protein HY062_02795 [Bacteroidetes bacterium]|nr:hypothetical protein [Bacteroidota bacterium]
MRLKLIISALLFCAVIQAQTKSELREFINKNNVAIRAVQKNLLDETNPERIASFKELVKNQVAAVKKYDSDKNAGAYFAFLVRTECLAFLKKYTKGSTDYFEVSASEKVLEHSAGSSVSDVLSASEIKAIDAMDISNPQVLKSLNLTIQ